ncbi:hypothetical protein HNQ53_002230 [Microbulbifer hydrolyticus]|uniref:Uncharacterized protein n=1 Tax=Microbulbifer hydrolyticus TaxID=48074 RepID=A0AA89T647_9GAMM|nr:hypothetical protein [Microbulbifer hydrolyticus]
MRAALSGSRFSATMSGKNRSSIQFSQFAICIDYLTVPMQQSPNFTQQVAHLRNIDAPTHEILFKHGGWNV